MRRFGMITEDFFTVISEIVENKIASTRVATLAKVTEVFDHHITVKPVIKERIKSPTGYRFVELPEIRNVKYCKNQNPKVDDYVICIHGDRTPENMNIETGVAEAGINCHCYNTAYAFVLNNGSEWENVELEDGVSVVDNSSTYNRYVSKEVIRNRSELRVIIKDGSTLIKDDILRMDLIDSGIDNFRVCFNYSGNSESLLFNINSQGKLNFDVLNSLPLEVAIQAR